MQKIYSVDTVSLALNKSNPPSLVVTANGTANTGGWKGFALVPLWNRTNPPVNGVYAFSFEGIRPTGMVTQVLTPTGDVQYTFTPWETEFVKSVVIYAATNKMQADRAIKAAVMAAGVETELPPPRKATGYSDNWSFREAFRDAIKNLPEDPNPYPDKLYHYRVITIEGEVGGIAGFNRMKVNIEG